MNAYTKNLLATLEAEEFNDNLLLDMMVDEAIAEQEAAEMRAWRYEHTTNREQYNAAEAYLKELEAVVLAATPEQRELGNKVYDLGHEMWVTLPEELKKGVFYIFEEPCRSAYYAEACRRFNVSLEDVRIGFEAVEAAGTYSDVYKDINGIRPRWKW